MELPLPTAPSSLLAEGVLSRPQATWSVLRSSLGGAVRSAPATFQLAVAAGLGLPPLMAGLIDAEKPVALALVDPAPAGDAHFVIGIPLNSGRELVAALSAGSSPPFAARLDPATGLTFLSPSRVTEDDLAIAVAGNCLVVSGDGPALSVAGAYVGRALAPRLSHGEELVLSFSARSLSGPVPAWLRAEASSLEAKLVQKDEEGRKRHGGRAPDFGDPRALVAVFAGFAASLVQVVESAQVIRLVARVHQGEATVRAELTPLPEGAARDLARSMPRGSAVELLALPAWTEGAVLFRPPPRVPGDVEANGAAIVAAPSVLGPRVDAAHRARLDTWVGDLRKGLGDEVVLGVFSADGSIGALALGPRGDGGGIRQAVTAFPGVLAIPAVADPIATFLGKVSVDRPRTGSGAHGETIARVELRTERKGDPAEPLALALVAGSHRGRVAVVLASSSAEERMTDLLGVSGSAASATLARDPHVVRAVDRGRSVTSAAVVVRFQDEAGHPEIGALLGGTTGESLWAELSGPGAAAFARAALATP